MRKIQFFRLLIIFCSLFIGLTNNAQKLVVQNLWDEQKLFTQMNNTIDIAIPENKQGSFEVVMSRGILTKAGDQYLFRCDVPGDVILTVKKGNELLFQKTMTVVEYPKPKLYVNGIGGRYSYLDFMNTKLYDPVFIGKRLELVSVWLSYKSDAEYTNQIKCLVKDKKLDLGNLPNYVTPNTRIYVDYFSYKNNTGSIFMVSNPDFQLLNWENLELFPNIVSSSSKMNNDCINIFSYPELIVTIAGKKSGAIYINDIQKNPKLVILNPAGKNTYNFTVKKFLLQILKENGKVERFQGDKSGITNKMKTAISRMKDGEMLSVSGIEISNSRKTMSVDDIQLIVEEAD